MSADSTLTMAEELNAIKVRLYDLSQLCSLVRDGAGAVHPSHGAMEVAIREIDDTCQDLETLERRTEELARELRS